jgi:pimeloyl-ACP methyl ester carboxylesterase
MSIPSRHQSLATLAIFVALSAAACAQDGATADNKPQTKGSPSEEAVRFVSLKYSLSGTLVLPTGSASQGSGPHPAVVLFHGSGPQRRDLFTARWFAAQGVAALAYDKRGVGESQGDFKSVPFMELSNDGLAAIAYLKSRKEIDPKRIGVWGLSQGGWLGPLAASRSSDVAFVIAVSGPGVSPGEQMIVYYANELRAAGVPEADVREASAVRRDIWSYMANGQGYEKAKHELEQSRTKRWYEKAKAQQDDSFGTLPAPAERTKHVGRSLLWFLQEAVYDPVPALRAVHVPALFLFGGKDQLIPVPESVAVLRRVLQEDGRHDFTIREFPNDDHGMILTSSAVASDAAGNAAGDIDPEYLKTMRDWLQKHVLAPPAAR